MILKGFSSFRISTIVILNKIMALYHYYHNEAMDDSVVRKMFGHRCSQQVIMQPHFTDHSLENFDFLHCQ